MKADEIKSNLVAVGNCINFEALEYINELETENKRLNKKVEELSEVLSDSIKIKVKEIKSEAIKEFAEKFQTRMQDLARIDNNGLPLFLVSEKFIDDFVKETVGG